MDSDEGEGFLPVGHDVNRNQVIVRNDQTCKQVDVCNRYGWSTHNCSCDASKTGIVLYPTDLQYKNIVILVCQKCYGHTPGEGTQHEQLEKWYYRIYGETKSFRFTTGFSLKDDGSLSFNSVSKNATSSAYHTQDKTMQKFECDAVTQVVRNKLNSYDARLNHSDKMLVGILVDVSGSMREVLQLDRRPEETTVSRIQSVFNTIINTAQSEVDSNMANKEMFVLAFGLKDVATCDLLALLDHVRTLKKQRDSVYRELNCNTADPRESFARLFEYNQTQYVARYIRKYMEKDDAKFGLELLSADKVLLTEIIDTLSNKQRELITGVHKRLTELLESYGALFVEQYVKNTLDDDEAKFAFQVLSKDTPLLREIVDLLPNRKTNPIKNSHEHLIMLLRDRRVLCATEFVESLPDCYTPELISQILSHKGRLLDAIVDLLPTANRYHGDPYRELSNLFARHGAPYTLEYIHRFVTREQAAFTLQALCEYKFLIRQIVDILPNACKYGSMNFLTSPLRIFNFHEETAINTVKTAMTMVLTAIGKDINDLKDRFMRNDLYHNGLTEYRDIINRIKPIVSKRIHDYIKAKVVLPPLMTMRNSKKKTAKYVLSLLRDVSEMQPESNSSSQKQKQISATEISNLTRSITPYIYGNTPMCEALKSALETFRCDSQNRKVVFLITDGESTDGDPSQFAKEFRENQIYVCGCLLTSNNISDPRRLYDTPDSNWTKAQRSLFELCITVSNMHPAMAVLLERDWKFPPSGQSRLFLQANHNDIIKEFSDVVRQLGEDNDVLLNLHSRILLDMDIIRYQSNMLPSTQEGETCYACAVATVFHLAMRRIMDREGGVPKIEEICESLIEKYGSSRARTKKVIEERCGDYRLRHKPVDNEHDARCAINARRPLVATFRLTTKELEKFVAFYKNSPEGILEKQNLITENPSTDHRGHAVVLIECQPTYLKFMNWWGPDKPGGLFFKIKDQSVLNLSFYDIYWDVDDLKSSEKIAFQNKSNRSIQSFLQNMPESVQNLYYECTECKRSSRATEFTGNLREAKCPKCNKTFKPVVTGFIQSLQRS